MRKLPSIGWGPWRKEFYSFHSNPNMIEADSKHEFGSWKNVWMNAVSNFIFKKWPAAWRKIVEFRGW